MSSYSGFQRLGFVIWSLIVRGEAAKAMGEAPRGKNNGAFSNREHSLFPVHFDNGPLEPRVVSEPLETWPKTYRIYKSCTYILIMLRLISFASPCM